ncbi:MAG: choice-of-anchor Q domain-containing protein [Anaerolineales bacterium]
MKKPLLILNFCLILLLAGSCATESPEEETITPQLSPTALPPTSTPAPLPTPSPTPTIIPPTPVSYPELDPIWQAAANFTVCRSGCSFTTIQSALDHVDGEELVILELPEGIHNEAGIVVTQNVVIRGQGLDLTVIQAADSTERAPDRVFLVKKGGTLILSSLTIQHGKPAELGDKGGGIRNFGDLTIINSQVRDNQANGGGGISNSGDLTIINSSIVDNLADGEAEPGLACGNGGGIQSGNGALFILNSTVSGNQSTVTGRARGGGIHVGCGCQAVIVNSTVSNNRAARQSGTDYKGGNSQGGGIFVAGHLQLIHTTITGNHANGEGGGIFVDKHLDYLNNLIAGNTGRGGNCVTRGSTQEYIGTNLYNFVGGGGCDGAFSGEAGLGPLEDNGGRTKTHALLPGSEALDLIPEIYCIVPEDQIGNTRPASADLPLMCDAGAYELQP